MNIKKKKFFSEDSIMNTGQSHESLPGVIEHHCGCGCGGNCGKNCRCAREKAEKE